MTGGAKPTRKADDEAQERQPKETPVWSTGRH